MTQPPQRLVGLTGGIASGKSTVARHLASLGATVIDADQVAREVVAPGSDGLRAIAATFGQAVIAADGALDRAAMRRLVMRDAEARAKLEAITHPLIATRILERVAAAFTEAELHPGQRAPVVVVEAALMVETGSYKRYPELIVVATTPDVQSARVMARDGVTADDAQRIIDAQAPLEAKLAVATYTLDNSGTAEALVAQIDALWRGWCADEPTTTANR